jgi:hypothetical protein
MQNVVRDWTEALWVSFANAIGIILAAIPKVIAFLVIIIDNSSIYSTQAFI